MLSQELFTTVHSTLMAALGDLAESPAPQQATGWEARWWSFMQMPLMPTHGFLGASPARAFGGGWNAAPP